MNGIAARSSEELANLLLQLQKKMFFMQEIEESEAAIFLTERQIAEVGKEAGGDYRVIAANDAFIQSHRLRIIQSNASINELQSELDEKEAFLREAMMEKKRLERLKEKQYKKYLEEAELEETEMIDEVSSNMFNREWRVND